MDHCALCRPHTSAVVCAGMYRQNIDGARQTEPVSGRGGAATCRRTELAQAEPRPRHGGGATRRTELAQAEPRPGRGGGATRRTELAKAEPHPGHGGGATRRLRLWKLRRRLDSKGLSGGPAVPQPPPPVVRVRQRRRPPTTPPPQHRAGARPVLEPELPLFVVVDVLRLKRSAATLTQPLRNAGVAHRPKKKEIKKSRDVANAIA